MSKRSRKTVADALTSILHRVSEASGLPWNGPWVVQAEVEANPADGVLTLTARLTLQAPELEGAEDRSELLEDLNTVLMLARDRPEAN